jgi:hypothetical protein
MVDDIDDETKNEDELVFTKSSCDREVWDEQVPRKVGLYHAFVRPHTKDSIEHKLFIVVSGSLHFLDEEFHRIWQDCNSFATCEQLLESEELQWFRSATLRNHNRVAARVADGLGLPFRCFIDAPGAPCGWMLFSTQVLQWSALRNACRRRLLAVYRTSRPRELQHVWQHHTDEIFEREEAVEVETLFPDENFMRKCEALGFNWNNAIVSLMPLSTYITEKSI